MDTFNYIVNVIFRSESNGRAPTVVEGCGVKKRMVGRVCVRVCVWKGGRGEREISNSPLRRLRLSFLLRVGWCYIASLPEPRILL